MAIEYGNGMNISAVCNKCGKLILPGNRPDGIPNGVGFVGENGKVVNMCAECLIKLGRELEGRR